MKISGLQKLTTIDYPGEIACIIFLHGCNFRCGFCYNPILVIGDAIENSELGWTGSPELRRELRYPHKYKRKTGWGTPTQNSDENSELRTQNSEGEGNTTDGGAGGRGQGTGGRDGGAGGGSQSEAVSTLNSQSSETEGFSEEDILKFLKKKIGKLDAVCITGGEPLMTLDFDFVREIKKLGYKIKIDTNGSFPNRLREMIDLGLIDYVAMDVKGSPENYSKVAGVVVDLKKIEESIKLVHEFRTQNSELRYPHRYREKSGWGTPTQNSELRRELRTQNRGYEFRTTVVGRYHNVDSLRVLAKWLNKICGAKPKRYFLQGFKRNEEGMIDSSFLEEKNVDEKFLNELKKSVEEFFEEVGVRV